MPGAQPKAHSPVPWQPDPHFQKIIEASGQHIALTDQQGQILYANSVAQFLGYPHETFVGINLSTIVHPDDLPNVQTFWQTLLSAPNSSGTIAVRSRHQQGHYTWVEVTAINLLLEPDVGAIVLNSRDISKRRSTEEARQRNEALFRATFEQAAVGMAHVAPDGRWLRVNQRLCTIVGYTAEELAQKTFQDLTYPADLAADMEATCQLLQGKAQTYSLHKRYFHRCGHIIWVNLTVSLVRDAEGKPDYFVAVLEEITKLKQAEQALHQSEERYRRVVEDQTDLICRLDAGFNLTFVNQAYSNLFGKQPDALIGQNLIAPIPAEHQIHVLAHFASLHSGQQIATSENPIRLANGELRWFQWTNRVIVDESGRAVEYQSVGRDITKEKSLQQEQQRHAHTVEEMRQFLQSALDAFSASTAVLANDGTIININAMWQRFGAENGSPSSTHYLGENYLAVCDRATGPDADEAMPAAAGIRAVIEGRQPDFYLEYPCHSPTEKRWFGLRVTPFAEAPPRRVILAHTDITAQKRIKDHLSQQKEILQKIFDHTPVMLSFIDKTGRIQLVNRAWEDVLGWSLEEITRENINMGVACFPDPTDRQKIEDFIGKSSDTWGEFRPRIRDGSIIDVNMAIVRLSDGTMIVIGQDISARKHAEQALKQSEERYRDLVENARDIIYAHDMHGNFTAINKTGEQITGYNRNEACQINLAQIIAPEYLEKITQSLTQNVVKREESVYDLEIITKDGRRIALEVNAHFVFEDDVPVGVQGIARDVTERKQLEAQLRQSQKMEAVGQLAGGIAHDFNNLLTTITGYSDLALRKLQPGDPLSRSLEQIKKAGERAASLTQQLLAFSRKQFLQPKVLDLNAVVAEMEKMLQRLIGEDIVLQTELAATLGHIKADAGQIEQVILNLAVNARDAMPQGGRLTIETQNVDLDEEYASRHIGVRAGPHVMLAVSDTGSGMDEETQRHIFEPFFTTKEVGKGTGLGLSTVYGIVTQSNGSLWVASKVNQGTTFTLYLPSIDEVAPIAKPKRETEAAILGAETILLAEDDEMVRNLVCEVLKRYDYQVLEATNGGEAARLSEEYQGPIDLLLTDVIMPEMSGRELAKRLVQLRPEMKVLYMSGYPDHAIVQHGMLDPETPFLQKPFTPHALARRVRDVLDLNSEQDGKN